MLRYYTAIIFLSIAAMVIVQIGINESHTLTQGRKDLFHKLFNAIIIAAFCEWFGNYLQGTGVTTRGLHITVKAVEFSVAPSIAFFISWIIERRNEKIIYLYLAVHALIECISGFWGGAIYHIDENSNYMHGEFYWIYITAYMISIAYCIYIVLKNVKRYQYNGAVGFLLIVAFMIGGIIIQLYDSSLRVDYVTLGIASIMLYVFTLEMINQTDELTELINRRGFENYIKQIEEKCMILFFDVDGFKQINDDYGHAFGDDVLRTLGKMVKKHYAKSGKCFRYGGDEFCVILTNNLDKVEQINQELFDEIKMRRENNPILPMVSIGYSYYDPRNQSIQEAMAEADQIMYKYKRKHKNTRLPQ